MIKITFKNYHKNNLSCGWNFYDHIDKCVVFEVHTTLGFNENMNWEQRWWGNVEFPYIVDLRKKMVSGDNV